jgi:hypothetical protein
MGRKKRAFLDNMEPETGVTGMETGDKTPIKSDVADSTENGNNDTESIETIESQQDITAENKDDIVIKPVDLDTKKEIVKPRFTNSMERMNTGDNKTCTYSGDKQCMLKHGITGECLRGGIIGGFNKYYLPCERDIT